MAAIGDLSQPSWAAWIEIAFSAVTHIPSRRRSPHGLRGLKYFLKRALSMPVSSRSPHGLRGLKWQRGKPGAYYARVAALMGCVD